MEILDGKTMDLVQQNIDELKKLFPEAITEGKIDFDRLRLLLGDEVETGKERYEFTWPGKSDCIRLAQQQSTGTLRPDKETSKDWDTTQNLYIEGDNLEVLRILQKSYHRKVKMIYIDPPYNTGGDFIYKDDFKDNIKHYKEMTEQSLMANPSTSGRYHSDWLNMMYPRLRLAKNLLREDGIIFISINDNEADNLKKICNEIFGEENFKGQITRATGTPTGQGTDRLVNELDYILVYSKSNLGIFSGLPFSQEDEKIYNEIDKKGRYLTRPLRKTGGEDRLEDRPSMYFAIKNPDGKDVYPVGPSGYKSRWRCSESRYHQLVEEGLIEWKKAVDNGKEKWKPYQKFYLDGRLKQPSNLWTKIEGNKKATIEVRDLLKGNIFDFPKPVELIKQCIKISSDGGIILDFFSGSSTTAHAVMQLNSEDAAQCHFIMVQLPETCGEDTDAAKAGYQNICEIGKERIRRAGEKIKEENKDKEEIENLDIGFRVFKLDTSNLKAWDPEVEELENTLKGFVDSIKEDRTPKDMLFEIMLKYGIDLTMPVDEIEISGKKAYSVGLGYLIVCLEDGLTLDVIEAIGAMKQAGQEIARVVFRDSGFDDDNVKTNAVQLLKKFGIEDFRAI
jgi:adenine-specific DNA-methyltransferase